MQIKIQIPSCLEDDCLSYLMARHCVECSCGLHRECGFKFNCPFSENERSMVLSKANPASSSEGILTRRWKSAIVANRDCRYRAAYEEGRKEAEERWKAKEEKWQTSE